MSRPASQRAFSLVELSIVLVILGLLVGGILAGQSLIRASELRAVGAEYARIQTAIHAFRDKYFALPGDMANATSLWGAADGSTGTTNACFNAATTNTPTCNGNNDGKLNWTSYSAEPLRFWQHLAAAGLIEGSYDGVTHGGGATQANSYNSKLGGIWYPDTINGALSGNFSLFDGTYGNYLTVGMPVAGGAPYASILRPEEAWNIDTKLDDGKPGTGRIWGRDIAGFTGNYCTTATASSQKVSAEYNLNPTNKGLLCTLIIPQAF